MRLQLCSVIFMLAATTVIAQNRACQVLTPQEIGATLGDRPASDGIPSPIDGGSACNYRSPGVLVNVSVLDKDIEAQFTRIKGRVSNVQDIPGTGDAPSCTNREVCTTSWWQSTVLGSRFSSGEKARKACGRHWSSSPRSQPRTSKATTQFPKEEA